MDLSFSESVHVRSSLRTIVVSLHGLCFGTFWEEVLDNRVTVAVDLRLAGRSWLPRAYRSHISMWSVASFTSKFASQGLYFFLV